MIKEGKKICIKCLMNIDTKRDKYVMIGTYNIPSKPDDKQFLHFNCWVEYFNNYVMNKAKLMIQEMQSHAMEVFNNPAIRSILDRIQGGNQIFDMLQTPLEQKVITLHKIDDDGKQKKRRRSSRRI